MEKGQRENVGFFRRSENMLAIVGGKPVRETMLQYGKQSIDESDIEAVVSTLRSPMLTQGPMIEAFEMKVADYVGAKYAVAFSNGTAALHGAYYAAGIGTGDEIITTPITFVATANAALYLGSKPIFADIDENTYNLDPKKVEALITDKTKAIVPVDFTGQPANYTEFRELADKYGLVLIGDGAHSLGSTYEGKKVGTQADMTMFSFHPVKPVTTGEGGIIVTDNHEYAEKMRLFRSHGIKKEVHDEGPWYYEMIDLGMNYRMTDLQAALGVSQMNKLDQFIERRRKIAETYSRAFSMEQNILTAPYQAGHVSSGWHLYILSLNLKKLSASRKQIFEALRSENIGVNVHYIPVYKHPYYQSLGYDKNNTPIAEEWYQTAITLPLFPTMTDQDIEDVVLAVKKVIKHYKKGV